MELFSNIPRMEIRKDGLSSGSSYRDPDTHSIIKHFQLLKLFNNRQCSEVVDSPSPTSKQRTEAKHQEHAEGSPALEGRSNRGPVHSYNPKLLSVCTEVRKGDGDRD